MKIAAFFVSLVAIASAEVSNGADVALKHESTAESHGENEAANEERALVPLPDPLADPPVDSIPMNEEEDKGEKKKTKKKEKKHKKQKGGGQKKKKDEIKKKHKGRNKTSKEIDQPVIAGATESPTQNPTTSPSRHSSKGSKIPSSNSTSHPISSLPTPNPTRATMASPTPPPTPNPTRAMTRSPTPPPTIKSTSLPTKANEPANDPAPTPANPTPPPTTKSPSPPPTVSQPANDPAPPTTAPPTFDPEFAALLAKFPHPYPHTRFTQWLGLVAAERAIAGVSLGYDQDTWDNLEEADVESDVFADLSAAEQAGVASLGMYEAVWDCFLNHYAALYWEELQDAGVAQFYAVLGWTEIMWDEEEDEPATEDMYWEELSAEQQDAAYSLCYFEKSWDWIILEEW